MLCTVDICECFSLYYMLMLMFVGTLVVNHVLSDMLMLMFVGTLVVQ